MIEPYYERDGIKIFCGDCYQVMQELTEVSFDMVMVDPPYGDTSLDWDTADVAWISIVGRLLKPSGSVWSFGSLKYVFWLMRNAESHDWKLAGELIWEKQNGSGFHADRFKRVHELIVQFYRGRWDEIYKEPVMTNDATERRVRRKKRPTHMGHIEASSYRSEDGGPRLMRSVIFSRNCHGYADHPTQKPLSILEPMIQYSCPVGGVVFDPFAGSCSTLIAARRLGRQAVGIEKDEKFCEAAVRRLRQKDFGFGVYSENG